MRFLKFIFFGCLVGMVLTAASVFGLEYLFTLIRDLNDWVIASYGEQYTMLAYILVFGGGVGLCLGGFCYLLANMYEDEKE